MRIGGYKRIDFLAASPDKERYEKVKEIADFLEVPLREIKPPSFSEFLDIAKKTTEQMEKMDKIN